MKSTLEDETTLRSRLPPIDDLGGNFVAEYAMPIFAFRYALGRMSTAPSTCADWLVVNWQFLDERSRKVIDRDLEEAFAQDDRARREAKESGEKSAWHPLGHDCDRATWSRVRALYRTPRCVFCNKELGSDVPQTKHTDGERSCRDCVPWECEVCGQPFKQLESMTINPDTRRSRHVKLCGDKKGGSTDAAD